MLTGGRESERACERDSLQTLVESMAESESNTKPQYSPHARTHAGIDMEALAAQASDLSISGESSPFSGGNDADGCDAGNGPLSLLCEDAESLQQLARQGSWRAILEKTTRARDVQPHHDRLACIAFAVVALAKLRRFAEAADKIDDLGDLDAGKYRYESYPDQYPGVSGSMVPFAIRWLHAQLPQRLGKTQESLDRLYLLLDFVRRKLNSLSEGCRLPETSKSDLANVEGREFIGNSGSNEVEFSRSDGEFGGNAGGIQDDVLEKKEGGGSSTESTSELHNESVFDDEFGEFKSAEANTRIDVEKVRQDQWERREMVVISSILSHHLIQKEFDPCIRLLHKLLVRNRSDLRLLSKLGYVQLQVGDLNGARTTFSHIESVAGSDSSRRLFGEMEFKNLVNRNRALVHLIAKDYTFAIREYEEAIERNPEDIVAINNKALCLMYTRDLPDAIKVLEGALEREPTVALNETLVVNLCSMYELAYVNCTETKRTLNNWIVRVAPDDFDSSCTRM